MGDERRRPYDPEMLSNLIVASDNKFHCDLCKFTATPDKYRDHIASRDHEERRKDFFDEVFLMKMLEPNETHLKQLGVYLRNEADMRLLSKVDLQVIENNIRSVENLLRVKVSNLCKLRQYGSTLSGYGLRAISNVNLELILDGQSSNESPTGNVGNLLEQIADMLTEMNTFTRIRREFNAKVPKLHFIIPDCDLKFEISLSADTGYKTATLLQLYLNFDSRARNLAALLRDWAYESYLDDQENGTWPAITFPVLVIHFLQRCDPPVLPCLHEMYSLNDDDELLDIPTNINWQTHNKECEGSLWLRLLAYYAIHFQSETDVVSIRKLGAPDTHEDKKWGTKILAIEDPFRPNLNLSRSVGSMQIYHSFVRTLKLTLKYFTIPLSVKGPLYNEKDIEMNAILSNSNTQLDKLLLNETGSSRVLLLLQKYGHYFVLKNDVEDRVKKHENSGRFSFNISALPGYRYPAKFCRLCKKHGHFQSRCPDECYPALTVIEGNNEKHKMHLNDVCDNVYHQYKLTPGESKRHDAVVRSLEEFIQTHIEGAQLELFGSTKNGFGSSNCDLDICMTYASNKSGENVNQAEVVEELAMLLKQLGSVNNILPIPQAKVPIIKFSYYYKTNYDCDISLYNILAKYNTKLLRTYCEIDQRVQQMGFIVKHFAKTCDICDASRGSLSSYAYIIMTIHFLQQRNPPVIPVLQQLKSEKRANEEYVDGWNVGFFDEISEVKEVWDDYGKNKETVAELFIGFLRYYTEVFKFEDEVVCMRQKEPLKRMEKGWTGKRFAIEDPFLLTHNLGQGVDDHMAAFIKRAFYKGRNLIGSPPSVPPPSWDEYFFDRSKLTSGNLPIGRGCRKCGKIGHKYKDCVEKPMRDKRNTTQASRSQMHRPNAMRQNQAIGDYREVKTNDGVYGSELLLRELQKKLWNPHDIASKTPNPTRNQNASRSTNNRRMPAVDARRPANQQMQQQKTSNQNKKDEHLNAIHKTANPNREPGNFNQTDNYANQSRSKAKYNK